eukprot:CAMPEP_0197245374 /NCGR_PEP_ID=MMETSP1429-20130617/10179_1 /TAXON_ID=49237 /ORGANISM="Chaetoceros  sp., Strain UNC1202" /LENGTH=229 /DNA_ID=CAMNT_0042705853 /DNA_START=50 /DNA_END=739 /DNA_ORIENTATION=+
MTHEEEQLAQKATLSLQELPIKWYRKVRQISTSASTTEPPNGNEAEKEPNEEVEKPEQDTMDTSVTQDIFQQDQNDEVSQIEAYIGIHAVLSIIDTDLGPAVEVRSTGNLSQEFFEKYEFIGMDHKLDFISTLFSEDVGKEVFIKRIIPLDNLEYAAPGGKWKLENMFDVGSGYFHCGVKLYSRSEQWTFLGGGKKILMFDVLKPSTVRKREVISYINALTKWTEDRAR